jgi:thiol:disulfide interchange protein DsbD
MLTAIVGLPASAWAKPWWMRGVESNENDFLPPDVAFRVGARVEGSKLRVRWVIAGGYYLYKAKLQITAESPDLIVSQAVFPPGSMRTDPYLGTQEIFQREVVATVPFMRTDGGAHPLQIKVTYQGCAEAGLCYPPITRVLSPETAVPSVRPAQSQGWEGVAIVGGGLAFLFAGFVLRKGRQLDTPAT